MNLSRGIRAIQPNRTHIEYHLPAAPASSQTSKAGENPLLDRHGDPFVPFTDDSGTEQAWWTRAPGPEWLAARLAGHIGYVTAGPRGARPPGTQHTFQNALVQLKLLIPGYFETNGLGNWWLARPNEARPGGPGPLVALANTIDLWNEYLSAHILFKRAHKRFSESNPLALIQHDLWTRFGD